MHRFGKNGVVDNGRACFGCFGLLLTYQAAFGLVIKFTGRDDSVAFDTNTPAVFTAKHIRRSRRFETAPAAGLVANVTLALARSTAGNITMPTGGGTIGAHILIAAVAEVAVIIADAGAAIPAQDAVPFFQGCVGAGGVVGFEDTVDQ